MKLYLSSNFIPAPAALEALCNKRLSEMNFALIPNAKDYYSERARNFKINAGLECFRSLGINTLVVDLKDYTEPETLREVLSKFDIIWGYGGNTFCLRYEMKRSGFDQIIGDLLEEGMIYGGESAGAMVAGSTIRGSESADLPEAAEEIIWDGLKIIDKVIMPHADSVAFEETVRLMRDMYKDDPTYLELKESDVFIKDGDVEIVQSGKS